MLALLAALLGFAAVLIAAHPIEHLARDVPFANVVYNCAQPGTAALTFDDGPHQFTKSIADHLTAANAKGTFFFNGNNYECIYGLDGMQSVWYVHNQGHQVASHTWRHLDLTELNWDQINDQLWRTDRALFRITGQWVSFMRPPFGAYNDLVLQAAHVRGETVTIWNVDSQDYNTTIPLAQKEQAYTDAIAKNINILALNHETQQITVDTILPFAIKALQGAGYRLVTVAECLGMEPYQNGLASVPEPQEENPEWYPDCQFFQ